MKIIIISLVSLVMVTVFGSIGISNAYGDFTYFEQLRYAVISEKMIGHVIASYDNLGKGQEGEKLAQLHLTHPFTEEFNKLKYFYRDLGDFEKKSQYVLFIVANSNQDDLNQTLNEQVKNVLTLTQQGNNLILDGELKSDKFFNLFLVNSLLEEVKIELIDASNSEGLIKSMEIQDSFAFSIRAHMLMQQIQDIDSELKSNSEKLFIELFFAYGDKKPISERITIIEKIILANYEYIITEKPVLKNIGKEIIHNKERVVLLEENQYANRKMLTFVGTDFPENQKLEIKYTASNGDKLYELSTTSTHEGKFYLPIGFVDSDETYYVTVKCAEITTLHILKDGVLSMS